MGFKRGNRVYHKDTPNSIGTVTKGNYKWCGVIEVRLDSCKSVVYDINDVVKVTKETIDKNIKCCPYCGSEEYYIKQSFKGTCNYQLRFDGKEGDNTMMHGNTQYTNTSKYAYCSECNKSLFEIDN